MRDAAPPPGSPGSALPRNQSVNWSCDLPVPLLLGDVVDRVDFNRGRGSFGRRRSGSHGPVLIPRAPHRIAWIGYSAYRILSETVNGSTRPMAKSTLTKADATRTASGGSGRHKLDATERAHGRAAAAGRAADDHPAGPNLWVSPRSRPAASSSG